MRLFSKLPHSDQIYSLLAKPVLCFFIVTYKVEHHRQHLMPTWGSNPNLLPYLEVALPIKLVSQFLRIMYILYFRSCMIDFDITINLKRRMKRYYSAFRSLFFQQFSDKRTYPACGFLTELLPRHHPYDLGGFRSLYLFVGNNL